MLPRWPETPVRRGRSGEAFRQPVGHDGQRLLAMTLEVVRRALQSRRTSRRRRRRCRRSPSACHTRISVSAVGCTRMVGTVTFGIVSANLAWLDSPDQVYSHPRAVIVRARPPRP